jgi:hypothetical protein
MYVLGSVASWNGYYGAARPVTAVSSPVVSPYELLVAKRFYEKTPVSYPRSSSISQMVCPGASRSFRDATLCSGISSPVNRLVWLKRFHILGERT